MPNIKTQREDFVYIKDLASLFIRKWYWFVFSVILCLGVAFTYIVITPPIYTRSASISIKNSKSSTTSGVDPLSDIGLFKQTTDAQSEVYVLKSPQLMMSVINRLKLNYNYSIKFKKVRNVDLYNNTPVFVKLDSILNNAVISFGIMIHELGAISLVDFKINNQYVGYQVDGKLSQPITTPYGVIIVDSTAVYTPNSVGKTIVFSRSDPNSLAKSFANQLSVSIPEESVPIVQLSYVDVNAQRAEDILSSVISVYNENWIKDKNQITFSTSEFINERLNIIEDELGNVDENISTFKSENLLPDVKAVSSMYLSQYESNTAKLTVLQNQLSMAQYIQDYIRDAAYKNQLIPANTGIDNNTIETHIEKYNSILLQKNNLLSNSSEQNPVVADMIKSLGALKEVIVRSIDDYTSTIKIQLNNLRQEEKATNRKIATNPNQAKYLLSVERQQKVKEALYLFLLQKREENELSQTFTAYNTKIITLPNGDKAPTAPRRKVIMIAALIIALVIPCILIYLIESLDTFVRCGTDLGGLSAPYVGDIPMTDRKKWLFKRKKSPKDISKEGVKILVSAQKRDVINEAFRNIRNNIDFMRPKGLQSTVIMTTSIFPGSGKTFITSNIALSMALKGSRTAIIDLDLRKATLSKLIDSPKKGVSDYLAGNIDSIEQVIVKSALNPNLDVIPAGRIAPNPSELILGERFGELLSFLRSKYDYIFLDCPPIDIVSETAIIGGASDMTLFVIRAGLLDKRMLPQIEDIYRKGQFKHIGVILNDVDYSSRYGYGKYGYSSYGNYGEGYDSK